MEKYINHFLTICKHKYYVAIELIKVGKIWQAITHDLSKFSLTEFNASAKFFDGSRSPIEKEKEESGYSLAWLHHKGRNKHHWQYWVDFENGKPIVNHIPVKYLIEMAADIVGASKAYLKGSYDPLEPIKYFECNSFGWLMTDDDKQIVRFYIKEFTIPYNG